VPRDDAYIGRERKVSGRRGLWCLLTLSALGGCRSSGEAAGPPPAARVTLVLADRSASDALVDTRRMFAETFHAFAGQVHPGDVLAVAWISDRSASELRLPIKHEFPPPDTAGRNAHYRKLILEASRKLTAQTAESLATRFDLMLRDTGNAAPSTDILGSLELAKRVFSLYPNMDHILLVMSDMRETSRVVGLDAVTMKGVDSLVSRLRNAGRVADLGNAHVCVLGASHPSPERFRIIREFWTRYFAATGAQLRDYGAALVRAEC